MSDDGTVRVGIDLGTGSARAFAVAADGTVVGRGSHELRSPWRRSSSKSAS